MPVLPGFTMMADFTTLHVGFHMILSKSGVQAKRNGEIVEAMVLHVANDNIIDLLVDQSREIYLDEDYGLIKEVAIKGYPPQEGNHRIYRLLPDAMAASAASSSAGNRFEFFRNMDNTLVVFQTFDSRNYSDSQIASMSFMTRLARLMVKLENPSSLRLSTELTQLGRGLRPFEKDFEDDFFDLRDLQMTVEPVTRPNEQQTIFVNLGFPMENFDDKQISINVFLMFIRSDRIPPAFRVSVGELRRRHRETSTRNIELNSSERYANWRPPSRRRRGVVESRSPQLVRQPSAAVRPLLEQAQANGGLRTLAAEIAANGYFESLPEPLASRVWRDTMPRHGRSWNNRLAAANEILAREDSRFKSLRAQATEIVASEDFERLREPLRSEVRRAAMSQNGRPWSNRVDAVYEILDRYV